ncbi:hypothetical protein L6452_14352 [Arctium lappa]|uniref:Uncharacterized protein n=1 Tax=Arctium lappa TaxID=4217 RepID=A0ACB9CKQ3_ARCLA|nr:hypothetical protein L6452_14352 [Arctium lappa]
MDNSQVWNKFSMKIIGYSNCGRDERKIRRGLRRIKHTHLISIDLERGAFTVSTINHPIHLIQALQNLLHKQVILDQHDQQDPPPVQSPAPASGNIIDADQIPLFLDKVSRNGNLNAVDVCIRFDLKDISGSNVDRSSVLHGSRGNHVSMVGYASPPLLLLPSGIRPSEPMLPEKEAYYGYPITTAVPVGRRPEYYYYGSSTSSDDYPKDYSCIIL